MRAGAIVLLSSILLATPAAEASGSGVALSGPSVLRTGVTTSVPFGVTLSLAGIACASEAEIPVALGLVAQDVEASLAFDSLVFVVPATDVIARPWSGRGEVALRVTPTAASGIVSLLATFELPPQCVATQGEPRGEARHEMRIEEPAARAAPRVATARETPATGDASPPAGLLLAVAGTVAGALLVLVKRMRASGAR